MVYSRGVLLLLCFITCSYFCAVFEDWRRQCCLAGVRFGIHMDVGW